MGLTDYWALFSDSIVGAVSFFTPSFPCVPSLKNQTFPMLPPCCRHPHLFFMLRVFYIIYFEKTFELHSLKIKKNLNYII